MMHKLNKSDYLEVSPIFSLVINSKPVIFSVIDGNLDGMIYVDDIENPKTAFVMLYDMLFFSGQKNLKFCKEAFDLLTTEIFPAMNEDYFDCYCLSDGLRKEIEQIFSSKISGRPVRKTWIFNETTFKQHTNWRDKLPDGFYMEIMDDKFISKYNCDKDFWNPTTKRFGYSLVHDDKIVSECIACFVGAGQAEISVDTIEQYRNKGFATITCAAFIEHCISINLIPNWSCWDFRTASIALAKKLGFIENTNDIVFGLTK